MSLKMCCFASGSKGNCCYVSDGATDILIDLGISALRAEKCLAAVGADMSRLHILLTHSHSDHLGGIKVFCRRHPQVKVHCQSESARQVAFITGVGPVVEGRSFVIGDIAVDAVPVPHDVPCFGYVVKNRGKCVGVVTDIGMAGDGVLGELSRCDLVMLEANHDVERLKHNPTYSAQLKARIASSHGHLSNADCANACAYLAGRGVKNFILAHLSEENNTPQLALAAVRAGLTGMGVTDANITVAAQDMPTGLFEVC